MKKFLVAISCLMFVFSVATAEARNEEVYSESFTLANDGDTEAIDFNDERVYTIEVTVKDGNIRFAFGGTEADTESGGMILEGVTRIFTPRQTGAAGKKELSIVADDPAGATVGVRAVD